jgi:multidrug efflux pump subunit AcrA (membrane-fusion protein)
MEKREYVELRSEDVQEILGTPPGWLVRWGTTVVLLGCIFLVAGAWFVRYPDVVEAKIVLATSNPALDIIARANGRIARFFVEDREIVPENYTLAVLQNTADFQHLMQVDALVATWQKAPIESLRQANPPDSLELGDVQFAYADFIQNFELYKFGKSSRTATTSSNIGSINQQIVQLQQSIDFDKKALRRVQEQIGPAEELYKNQKKLYEEGVISQSSFAAERTKLAELEQQYDNYNENIIRKQNEIINLRRGITDASFSREENEAGALTRLRNSLSTLRSQIDKWKQTYLLVSPISGQVSFGGSFFSANQFVKEGDQVMTIVPPEDGDIIGRLALPVAGSGKVKQGQQVIIKLESYPYHEYGSIVGQVLSKSLIPKDEQYVIIVQVERKDGKLMTTYHREITFEQQLQGKAEIVTEDKGLLERIGDQVFAGMK